MGVLVIREATAAVVEIHRRPKPAAGPNRRARTEKHNSTWWGHEPCYLERFTSSTLSMPVAAADNQWDALAT